MATRSQAVNIAKQYLGAKQGSSLHHKLVDTFNQKHPHGEYGNYSCAWCAISWTAWQLLAGLTDKQTPMSYNCGTLIEDAKRLGCWVENDNYLPKSGDGIIYYWSDSGVGELTHGCDHVGMVVDVRGNEIKVIEGNYSTQKKVAYRTITRNQRYIRGYIVPKYNGKSKYTGAFPNLTVTKSTVCKIGQARIGDGGKKSGGKVGDQSGNEVTISNWHYSSKASSSFHWKFVARATDPAKRTVMAQTMKDLCNNNNIGYSQKPAGGRKALYNKLKALKFRAKSVGKVDTSCTPIVCASIASAGINIKQGLAAHQLKSAIVETKAFNVYTSSKYTGSAKLLKTGDILNSGRHSAMVVQAQSKTTKTVALKKGDKRTAEVKKLQRFLNWYGDDLKIDGVYGTATVNAVAKFKRDMGNSNKNGAIFGAAILKKAKGVRR